MTGDEVINGQFRFAEVEKVWWPTDVRVYGEEPEDEDTIEVQWLVSVPKRETFEKLGRLEQEVLHHARRLQRGEAVGEEATKVSRELSKIVIDNVHGWRGIVGENGKELPYGKANKQRLLENTRLFNAALTALYRSASGAARKNSNAGAGG